MLMIALTASLTHAQLGVPENLSGIRAFCVVVDAQSDSGPAELIRTDVIEIMSFLAQRHGIDLSTDCRFGAGTSEDSTQGLFYVIAWSEGSAITTQLHVINMQVEAPLQASVWFHTALDGDVPKIDWRGTHGLQILSLFERFALAWHSENP